MTKPATQHQPKEQKCIFIGCQYLGVPQEGFDFYVCDDCLDTLEKILEREWVNQYLRHPKN